MVAPSEVVGTQIEVLELIRDTGDRGFSVARLRDFGRERVGIRWNGDGRNQGAPTVGGRARWFLVPDEVADLLLDHYRARENRSAA